MKRLIIFFICSITLSNCASKKIKDITYKIAENSARAEANKLNVFTPRKTTSKSLPVIIFVHGGYWESGDKDIYGFLGRNFAKHNVVTVIPNYRLSPNASYIEMGNDVVKAIEWTQKNIEDYGGDSNQIYLMGHSAGGHLIALVSTNPKYEITKGMIKGIILNDAAGLDMKSYLDTYPPTSDHNYDVTWTTNPDHWKDASPIYFLESDSPPFLIYLGEKTYPSIKSQNITFLDTLHQYKPNAEIKYLDKKHVPMMSHYFFPWVNRYKEILKFMKH